jgi:hypothetical protein
MYLHSYTVAHYGKDYIGYALRSVYDFVDQAHVIYTPTPSHGHQIDVPPIESRLDVMLAATDYDPHAKLRWYETKHVRYEGLQRDMAVRTCYQAGAEMILVVDCDEVWPAEVLRQALDYAWRENRARNWLVNFTHLWRSFNWCCRDEGWPVRIIDLRHAEGTAYIPRELGEIYHFGYAVRHEIMAYKWKIHGHKDEMRPGWLATKWAAWPPDEDCHPTNNQGFWNPEPFDRERLPELMRAHPFWDLERV